MKVVYTVELEVELNRRFQPPSPQVLKEYVESFLVENDHGDLQPYWIRSVGVEPTIEIVEE